MARVWQVGILTSLLLTGCNHQASQKVLVLNVSESATEVVSSSPAQRAINRVIYQVKPKMLLVIVTARHPIWFWQETRRLDAQKLWQIIHKKRQRQREFGLFTDHVPAFKIAAQHRRQRLPATIVMISDGENEGYPWDKVVASLQQLYQSGPTRLIGLGLSQRIIDPEKHLSVIDRWHTSLLELGAKDLVLEPKAQKAFYLSDDVNLPMTLLN